MYNTFPYVLTPAANIEGFDRLKLLVFWTWWPVMSMQEISGSLEVGDLVC